MWQDDIAKELTADTLRVGLSTKFPTFPVYTGDILLNK